MNPYWMGAITGVAASFVGLLGAVVVAYANHRLERGREHERWQREQKQAALIRRVEEARDRVTAIMRMNVVAWLSTVADPGDNLSNETALRFMEVVFREWPMFPREHEGELGAEMEKLTESGFDREQAFKVTEAMALGREAARLELEQALQERDAALKSK